jgi:hypothetical protein
LTVVVVVGPAFTPKYPPVMRLWMMVIPLDPGSTVTSSPLMTKLLNARLEPSSDAPASVAPPGVTGRMVTPSLDLRADTVSLP